MNAVINIIMDDIENESSYDTPPYRLRHGVKYDLYRCNHIKENECFIGNKGGAKSRHLWIPFMRGYKTASNGFRILKKSYDEDTEHHEYVRAKQYGNFKLFQRSVLSGEI